MSILYLVLHISQITPGNHIRVCCPSHLLQTQNIYCWGHREVQCWVSLTELLLAYNAFVRHPPQANPQFTGNTAIKWGHSYKKNICDLKSIVPAYGVKTSKQILGEFAFDYLATCFVSISPTLLALFTCFDCMSRNTHELHIGYIRIAVHLSKQLHYERISVFSADCKWGFLEPLYLVASTNQKLACEVLRGHTLNHSSRK